MKNKVRLLLVLALLLVVPAITLATGSASSGYNEPILEEALEFEAVLDGDQVNTSWVKYAPEGFNYYKVIRSTTNPDPVYPDDGYIQAIGDADTTSYVDHDVPEGVSYYRVCSIVNPNRYCSHVVTIEKGQSESVPELISAAPAVIELEGALTDKGAVLEWTLDGAAPHGFKVAYSKTNENPSYPGDSATYLSDPGVRRHVQSDVKAGYTYHFRVCQYNGDGTCGAYSNAVALAIPADYVTAGPVSKEVTTEKVVASGDEYQALKDEITALKARVAQLEAFIDIQQHKYETAINYLREQGIVQGYDDGSYKPDSTINRAEFMKIVMGEKYSDELSTAFVDCFNDVGKDWYAA
ncbi:S-layer homology domain-containing protein, partial [Candidatus Peregrinibacteria bacterium]|nr:S-layer homology domain-containing protein [Candidatus Peregrinibacteria bacterium]